MANPIERVERAADRATEPEHARKYATTDDIRGDVHEAIREQREEMDHAGTGPGLAVTTSGQRKGVLIGALVGGAIGIVLLAPASLLTWGGDLDLAWRLLIVGIVGALAGGTAGAVYFGGRVPEMEGETVDAAGRPDIGSSARDSSTDDRGRHVA